MNHQWLQSTQPIQIDHKNLGLSSVVWLSYLLSMHQSNVFVVGLYISSVYIGDTKSNSELTISTDFYSNIFLPNYEFSAQLGNLSKICGSF